MLTQQIKILKITSETKNLNICTYTRTWSQNLKIEKSVEVIINKGVIFLTSCFKNAYLHLCLRNDTLIK